jgi:L,D-transpeptidase YcbB
MAMRKAIIICLGVALVCFTSVVFIRTRHSQEKFPASNVLIQVREMIREHCGIAATRFRTAVEGEFILADTLLPHFYQQREFTPAWTPDGTLSSQAKALVKAIERAHLEGLQPLDYHLSKIVELSKIAERGKTKHSIRWTELLFGLDLLCTDAFLTYAGHLAHGKVDPETLKPAWQGLCVDEELIPTLEGALASDRIEETLGKLLPHHDFYTSLKKKLASCRELAKRQDWSVLSADPPLRKGDQGKRVKNLRRRLYDSGDLEDKTATHQDLFGDELEKALCGYQKRHGLEVTGVLDRPTVAALNIPFEERARQIEFNLERWRWLPHDLGERFIYVNIANFELELFEGSRRIIAMKVVAGAEAWQTPEFASQMTHLVINPYWTIPIPVLLKEIAGYILQDPNYLRNNKMVILRGRGDQEIEADADTIDWAKLTEKNLNFRIRQDPGPLNVLGRLKFVFPNKYEIFLHDTPYQEDFAKTARVFSHGCVRAEKPVELAAYVLRGKPGWDMERIMAAIEEPCEQTVKLIDPINVYFLYGTAWQDKDGQMQFRPDIYMKDLRLARALSQEPPAPPGPNR